MFHFPTVFFKKCIVHSTWSYFPHSAKSSQQPFGCHWAPEWEGNRASASGAKMAADQTSQGWLLPLSLRTCANSLGSMGGGRVSQSVDKSGGWTFAANYLTDPPPPPLWGGVRPARWKALRGTAPQPQTPRSCHRTAAERKKAHGVDLCKPFFWIHPPHHI